METSEVPGLKQTQAKTKKHKRETVKGKGHDHIYQGDRHTGMRAFDTVQNVPNIDWELLTGCSGKTHGVRQMPITRFSD